MLCCEYSPESFSLSLFTILHFLHNTLMSQKARVFISSKPFQLIVLIHFIVLCPIVSYEENEVL
jgi:hypothetical protein